jgi:hypothetical protein
MKRETRYNIECQNFDFYFSNEAEKITPESKAFLPMDVAFRMRPSGLGKLSFFDKLFILWKCLRKHWYLVIRDDEKGIGVKEFVELSNKRNKDSIKKTETLKSHGELVLANKELADTLTAMNNLSMGAAYNYVAKVKNVQPTKTDKFVDEMAYIARFMIFWEGNKRKMTNETSLNMPEILVLLYLYSAGTDVVGSVMYRETFKQTYQSSPRRIKQAFGSLQTRGYITKTGENSGATLRISALGRDTIARILIKYAANC